MVKQVPEEHLKAVRFCPAALCQQFTFSAFLPYTLGMGTKEVIKKTRPVLKRFGVEKAAIFGSYARGELKKESDVDILLKPSKESTLFDILKLKTALEKRLGRKVDLVEYGAIKPQIKRYVLRHQIPLL